MNRQLTDTRCAEFAGMHSAVTFDGKEVIEADDDTIKGAGAVKAVRLGDYVWRRPIPARP